MSTTDNINNPAKAGTSGSDRYTHRLLARIVVEAATPLAIGSGEYGALTDAIVAMDVNGLPYIPAKAIAGVLRSMLEAENAKTEEKFPLDEVFGCQRAEEGKGSEIIFSEAKILDSTGKVVDGLAPTASSTDSLLGAYKRLPIRQHVKMSHRGVAVDSGKFDEQVVYAGSRFCFEVEMVAKKDDTEIFKKVLGNLFAAGFRIGGGTRKGFGELKVIGKYSKIISLNLKEKKDLDIYLSKTSDLDSEFWANVKPLKAEDFGASSAGAYESLDITITPEGFFLFGSGFGDDDVDAVPVKASKVIWDDEGGKMSGKLESNLVLIPATSVKGALVHRVAFYWNRLNGIFADDLTDERFEAATEHNEAVEALFGYVSGENAARGNVFISDIIEKVDTTTEKVFNHVAIDRFTGGTIAGALFSEKATYTPGKAYPLKITLDTDGLKAAVGNDPEKYGKIYEALTSAIGDIESGMLPLGGRVNKGYGVFHKK